MKKVVFLLLAVCLLIPFGLASADDPAVGSKEDNACNAGGSLAGKCSTEQDWTCGWYIARYEAKTFSRAQVPALCSGFLPGAGTAGAATSSAVGPFCIITISYIPGSQLCVNGNQAATDFFPVDGVNGEFGYIGNCPPGTVKVTVVGSTHPEVRAFFNANGFPDSAPLCL